MSVLDTFRYEIYIEPIRYSLFQNSLSFLVYVFTLEIGRKLWNGLLTEKSNSHIFPNLWALLYVAFHFLFFNRNIKNNFFKYLFTLLKSPFLLVGLWEGLGWPTSSQKIRQNVKNIQHALKNIFIKQFFCIVTRSLEYRFY